MEDLRLNLSKNEFSKARKILLWVLASLFALGGAWDLYLKLIKHDYSAQIGLTVILFAISGFIFFIAVLASVTRKDHYFKVDNDHISYRYGLIFARQHSYNWSEIKNIIMRYKERKAILVLENGKQETINLNWVKRTNSTTILKHIYYLSKKLNIPVTRK